jgi:GTPase SAR1 family protein
MSCLRACGCGGPPGGAGHGGDEKENAKNRRLNQHLKDDYIKQSQIMKLLLLGPGESGKSTVFKQVNALFNKGYPEEERKRFRTIVFNNLYLGMRTLISESEKLAEEGIVEANATKICSDEALIAREVIEKIDYHDDLTPAIANQLLSLWHDKGIQKTWENRARFQCPYPIDFFMAKLQALTKPDYIPSQEDVLRCRVRTTGIVELEFVIEPNKYLIIDVGGQRNERKKWIHCFDKVTAMIFVAAISEFDQTLYEDQKTNRVVEGLDLFAEVSGLKVFQTTSIILFLNKIDLFKEKIRNGIRLEKYFPDYSGSTEESAALNFMREKFLQRAHPGKKVFVHFTCATDSELIRNVLMDVRDIILAKGDGQELLE